MWILFEYGVTGIVWMSGSMCVMPGTPAVTPSVTYSTKKAVLFIDETYQLVAETVTHVT